MFPVPHLSISSGLKLCFLVFHWFGKGLLRWMFTISNNYENEIRLSNVKYSRYSNPIVASVSLLAENCGTGGGKPGKMRKIQYGRRIIGF